MAELDQETIMQLGKLLGEFQGLHKRFDSMENTVNDGLKGVHDRLTKHEEREEPRLAKIERLLWIGVGGVVVLSALWPIGLSVIQKAVAAVIS